MKKELVFATNNAHKLQEVQQMLDENFVIKSLADIGFSGDIPETQPTIEGNAHQKSEYIFERFSCDVFADDTGLEIEALNGEPGVYSARYAGKNCSFKDNCDKVLTGLQGQINRKARFKTVIDLIIDGKVYQFEGIVEGEITSGYVGEGGFGYDPIFKPMGFDKTFAEMLLEEKNKISHRGRAVKKLVEFLNERF
jgi:XTP/dITP diphosphohydrolase